MDESGSESEASPEGDQRRVAMAGIAAGKRVDPTGLQFGSRMNSIDQRNLTLVKVEVRLRVGIAVWGQGRAVLHALDDIKLSDELSAREGVEAGGGLGAELVGRRAGAISIGRFRIPISVAPGEIASDKRAAFEILLVVSGRGRSGGRVSGEQD